MKPGDLIRVRSLAWKIEGVFLGASGQESVVKLRSITTRPPQGENGKPVEVYVPAGLIDAALGRGGAEHYVQAEETTLPRDQAEATHG